MDRKTAETVEDFSEKMEGHWDQLVASGALKPMLAELKTALSKIPNRYGLEFHLQVVVTDEKREAAMDLVQAGFSGHPDTEPYASSMGESFQRYWAKGEIVVVPHTYCPICWQHWDFKHEREECPDCDAKMGKDVRYFLDDDQCPYCSGGKLTSKTLTCDKCGHKVPKNHIAWG